MAIEHKLPYTASELEAILVKAEKAVTTNSQALTNAEKQQARKNIGVDGLVPSVTSADNGKILRVVDGVWKADTLAVYNGEVL